MLEKMLAFLNERVSAGDIYVWGGSGQTTITESWIRQKEATCDHGANADRAIAAWQKRKAKNSIPFRAYDCSGLVSAALVLVGLLTKRQNCDGLWARCTKITTPRNGALLFRVNKDNVQDETHVGFYFNGYQYHAKGRGPGVVKERYDPDYWYEIGWFKGMAEDSSPDVPEPPQDDKTTVVLALGTVYVRTGNGKQFSIIGTTSKGERLEYLGTEAADPKWHRVAFRGQPGWISSNTKYTRLVER